MNLLTLGLAFGGVVALVLSTRRQPNVPRAMRAETQAAPSAAPASTTGDAHIWRQGAQVLAAPPRTEADFSRVIAVFEGGEVVRRTGETTPLGGWTRIVFTAPSGRVFDGWVDPVVLATLPGVDSSTRRI